MAARLVVHDALDCKQLGKPNLTCTCIGLTVFLKVGVADQRMQRVNTSSLIYKELEFYRKCP